MVRGRQCVLVKHFRLRGGDGFLARAAGYIMVLPFTKVGNTEEEKFIPLEYKVSAESPWRLEKCREHLE